MSWITQNKFLAGFGAVMLAGVGTLGYLTYDASNVYDTARSEYESAVAELHRLEGLAPFPNDEHLKTFIAQKDELKARIGVLQMSLAATQLKADSISPTAFQDKLKEAVARVSGKIAEAKVKLPEKFYLGFAEYQSEPPKDAVAPFAFRELRSIELLMNMLIDAKEVSLNELTRSALKGERDAKAAVKVEEKTNAKDKGGDGEGKMKLVHKDSITLKFVTSQDRFNKILNQIVSCKEQFFIPRVVTVLNEKQEPPVAAALTGLVHAPVMVQSEAALVAALRDRQQLWDVLIIDRRLFGERTSETLSILGREKRRPRVVVLGQLTDSVRERASFSDATLFLTKPLRRLQLRSAIRLIAEGEKPKPATQPLTTAASTSTESPPRLLIVEDNEVNSRLAILLLEKLGYTAELAKDGSEALDRFSSGVYDGVLMDCHMPIMDGYEATRAIRELEASATWHRPRARIIAMTANAMTGERERCLVVGMDDYLAKPLRSAALQDALAQVRVLDAETSGQPKLKWTDAENSETLQSLNQLADELSAEAASQLLEQWLDDTPTRLEELMDLAGGSDQGTLRRVAHSLKGSSSLFGLSRISKLSREVEQLAELQIATGQTPLTCELVEAFDLVEPVLRRELLRLKTLPS